MLTYSRCGRTGCPLLTRSNSATTAGELTQHPYAVRGFRSSGWDIHGMCSSCLELRSRIGVCSVWPFQARGDNKVWADFHPSAQSLCAGEPGFPPQPTKFVCWGPRISTPAHKVRVLGTPDFRVLESVDISLPRRTSAESQLFQTVDRQQSSINPAAFFSTHST